jgi:CRP/FNR family transcriptional regulator, cyclic AMP receptor protein
MPRPSQPHRRPQVPVSGSPNASDTRARRPGSVKGSAEGQDGHVRPSTPHVFDLERFLESGGSTGRVAQHRAGDVIFAQGEACDAVFYLQHGGVKLEVLSHTGKEAIVAMLEPGDFFGEGALTGQPVRMATAVAIGPTTILVIEKQQMTRLLHEQHDLSDRFLVHVLARNVRIEADLVDHLFNSSEKRLARILLLLARYGKPDGPHRVIPKLSQETLAEMVGTTRSRVNLFMNKFKKLGYIEYNGGLKVNDSLLTIVLHD